MTTCLSSSSTSNRRARRVTRAQLSVGLCVFDLFALADVFQFRVHLVERNQRRECLEDAVGDPPAMPEIDPQLVQSAAELDLLRVGCLPRLESLGAMSDRKFHRVHPRDEEQI